MQTQQTDLFISPTGSKQSSTSHDPAAAIRPHAEKIADRIIDFLGEMGAYGATCDEMERSLGLIHATCSSRIVELCRLNRIAKTSKFRVTRTGCRAVVYVLGNKPDTDADHRPRRVSKRQRQLEGALQFLVREIGIVAKAPNLEASKPQHIFVNGFISKTALEDARKLLEA